MPREPVDVSIVIPLFNEEEVFAELIGRVAAVVAKLQGRGEGTPADAAGAGVEVILIDDGSRDATPELIEDACRRHPWCRGVLLSRNFGHQTAITAGMRHARGNAVVLLDGDLQDPPEVVEEFLAKLREGFDVVYAVRTQRKENIFKRAAYAAFYRLMKRLATVPVPLDAGDFCIMSRRVVRQINRMPERHRFVRGLRSWVGYRQVGHVYARGARAGGHSKYTFSKLLKLALDGIFTFSEKPLQWSTLAGLLVAAGSFVWGTYIVLWRLLSPHHAELQGWATLAVGMLFLGGVQLISIGILGEYVGRIHNEVKGRPLYVVDRRIGWKKPRRPEEVARLSPPEPLPRRDR
jgi:dolichol-phosphate mannosyltransferase